MSLFDHLLHNQLLVLNTFDISSDFYIKNQDITFRNSSSFNKNDNTHLNILVVDDEESCRMSLDMMLFSTNHNVIFANEGKPAISYLNDHAASVDLVILDLMMPEVHGSVVAYVMYKAEKLKHIPIIIGTGSNDEKEIQSAINCGAKKLMKKPYTKSQIIDAISEFKSIRR